MKVVKSGYSKKDLDVYEIDGIRYRTSNNRMLYHPDYHDRHGEPWEEDELIYLVQMRPGMKWHDISLALGRTHDVCANKYYELKRKNKLEYYRNLEMSI